MVRLGVVRRYIDPFDHHKDNFHKQYSNLTNTSPTAAKLIRQEKDEQLYNFVNNNEILPK
jgi:hypothetical protein